MADDLVVDTAFNEGMTTGGNALAGIKNGLTSAGKVVPKMLGFDISDNVAMLISIVVLLVIFYVFLWDRVSAVLGLKDGMTLSASDIATVTGVGSRAGHYGEFSGTNQNDTTGRAKAAFDTGREAFNNRAGPVYNEVANHTLMKADRKNTAIRQLAEVNQKRAAMSPADPYAPIPWSEFSAEWERANPTEGFEDSDLMSKSLY